MEMNIKPDDSTVLITLQNSTKPDQVVYVVADKANGRFETQGLRNLFGVQEIYMEGEDLLQDLPEYAQVLSFLFDTISTAQDLNLPYTYQDEFMFGNSKFTLFEEEGHRVLKKVSD